MVASTQGVLREPVLDGALRDIQFEGQPLAGPVLVPIESPQQRPEVLPEAHHRGPLLAAVAERRREHVGMVGATLRAAMSIQQVGSYLVYPLPDHSLEVTALDEDWTDQGANESEIAHKIAAHRRAKAAVPSRLGR